MLLVRTKKGNPQTALKNAANALSEEFAAARAVVKKELRKAG